MELEFHTRIAVRYLVKTKLSELYGSGFEDFFQDLMSLRYPDFADVRTAGSLGDQGSDGLTIAGRRLYACYGPQTFEFKRLKKKFEDDLASALAKRKEEFDTFVFVHNDIRGLHPELTSLLSAAQQANPDLTFEPFGYRKFRDEALKLERPQIEDLLGHQLPVQLVFSVSLEEVVPLLEHLSRARLARQSEDAIIQPSADKLDFNEFSEDTAEDIRRAIAQAPEIDRYYSMRDDVVERDEVARAFRDEYRLIRAQYSDADEIIHQLEQYILGNASAPPARRRAATVVIAYFFQSCDIFENPPPGWSAALNGGRS